MTAPDRPGTPDGRSAPETAGQAAREALRNRLIRAAGEIKNCRSVTGLCGPCETQIGDVMAAADAYAQAAIAAAAPAPAGEGGLTWEAWYLADGNSRTLAQDFTESKHDAMRRAFHAGKAAAQPSAALDLARAETAAIRAAGANTARELAEVTAERDALRELLAEVLGDISAGWLVATTSATLGKLGGWYERAGIEQP